MFSFASKLTHKPGSRQPEVVRAAAPMESSPPDTAGKATEKVWWMDSAHELEQGLEVTEMTDLPEDLFKGS
jgi:hypothetical protein